MNARVKTPEVHVVFDTNALFTEAEDKLLSRDLSVFVLGDAKKLGLAIKWYLPSVVVGERRRQMIERATRLLEPIGRMEKLLGHKLGINPEIIADRITGIIAREKTAHDLAELTPEVNLIDWEDIIRRSVERIQPFSDDKSEKGFKDAVIAEVFLQHLESCHKSPSTCRVIMVSNDGLLSASIKERSSRRNNAYIVSGLDELRTMLNAIAAHISQDDIQKLVGRASQIFFEKNADDELYTKWAVGSAVWNVFNEQVRKKYPLYTASERKTYIQGTTFIGKSAQTVNFESQVDTLILAQRAVYRAPDAHKNALSGLFQANPDMVNSQIAQGLLGVPSGQGLIPLGNAFAARELVEPTEIRRLKGVLTFSVTWSATLSRVGNLTRPQLGTITLKDENWDENPS